MKKTFYLFTVLTFTLFITSCNSDDDATSEDKNFIKVDDVESSLILGFADDYSDYPSGDTYNIDLTLLSTGFELREEYGYDGEGYGFELEIFTNTTKKLAPGTYNYSDDDINKPFTFVGIYFTTTDDTDDVSDPEIVGGTVTIISSKNNYYELTFDMVDDKGHKITGRYFGEVIYTPNLVP
ncbi:MAG: hypothetical protein ABJD66_15590 [Cellulophaga sp.]|uniref:hypothetical protein n=1 Tax=Cellulophaga sp. TaxID=1972202 RepID=UPI00326526BF